MTKALKEENLKVTLELHDLNHEVVSRLGNEYESSKGMFPVQRYAQLKTIIKTAIQASKHQNLGKHQKFGDAAEALRVKEEAKKDLKSMTKEDIGADTTTKRRHIEMIRALEEDYVSSKGVFPIRRYLLMKRMVKKRTRQQSHTL